MNGRRLASAAVLTVLAVALLAIAPAWGKPKPKPPKPDKTTTTVAVTTTTAEPTTTTIEETTTTAEPTTTTAEPTTTTVAATTTTAAGIFLTGTAPVTDQGLIIYGPDFVDLPIPGGDPATVQACPAGTTLDFQASTFQAPDNLTVDYFADYDVVIVTADLDTTGTVSYRLACV